AGDADGRGRRGRLRRFGAQGHRPGGQDHRRHGQRSALGGRVRSGPPGRARAAGLRPVTGPAPCVILDRSQLAENIGAVARVMANFGLDDLRLVRPRDGWPQERAWATASGADWVLDAVQVFDSVEAAIAVRHAVSATTARPRETRLPVRTARETAVVLHEQAGQGLKTGLLFGGERAGLETSDIALCRGIVTIPVDPRHHSLN